jgi:Zn-dependent protease
MSRTAAAPGLRVLGFPLHIRSGFLFFMLLLVVLHGNDYGLWLAGAIAGFTLLHELGHAVAARRAGATAEISLDFMAGYASYSSATPLGRGTHAFIALAGPLIHIVAGVALLLALGANPIDPPSGEHPAVLAVWWAVPVIGAFNLLPLVPLDGGSIVSNVLGRVWPDHADGFVLRASIVITIGAAVALAFFAETRGFIVFVGLLLVMQLQELFAERADQAVSPFEEAAEALREGDEQRARRLLVNALRRPSSTPAVPQQLTDDDARGLVALLPSPIPFGDPWNEYVLANVMIRAGRFEDAARYAAESYGREPRTLIAATVARAAGALADGDTAAAWLRTAADIGTAHPGLATIIDQAPELATVRQRPEVIALRQRLSSV